MVQINLNRNIYNIIFISAALLFLNVDCETLVTLSGKCINDFRSQSLKVHNYYRYYHSATTDTNYYLVENTTITNIAFNFADYLAKNDLFIHSGAKGLGENLAFSWSSNAPNLNNCAYFAKFFVDLWYNEIKYYDFRKPGFSPATGHFTQVVWKGSKQLGCGIAVTTNNKVYGVCNYAPPGNILGQFATNVLPYNTAKPKI